MQVEHAINCPGKILPIKGQLDGLGGIAFAAGIYRPMLRQG